MQSIILCIYFLLMIVAFYVRGILARRLLLIYIVLWMSLLLFSTFNLYGLYPVSNTAYSLLLLNVVMFTAGFSFSSVKQKTYSDYNSGRRDNICITLNKKISNQFAVLFVSLLTVLLGYYAYKYYNIINTSGILLGSELNERTVRFYVGQLFGSTFELLFYNYIFASVNYIMLFILSFRLIWGKVNALLVFLAVIYVSCFALIGAGRSALVELGTYFVAMYLIKQSISYKSSVAKSKLISMNLVNKKTFVVASVLLLIYCVTVYLTGIRMGLLEVSLDNFATAQSAFMDNIVTYMIGPFRAFDYGLHNFGNSLGFNFGRLTFAGLDEGIGNIVRLIYSDYPIMNHLTGELTAPAIYIGQSQNFNANYTCVYNYYFDMGIAGVILFPFLYGLFYHRMILNYERTPAAVSLFILIFILGTTISSTQTWKFQEPAAFLLLLGACFIQSRKILLRQN
jgi:oligosaccharide repeat unit polymerase